MEVNEVKLTVVKCNGTKEPFDPRKIASSISRANSDVTPECRLSEHRCNLIADEVRDFFKKCKDIISAGMIRDVVEDRLIELGSHSLARRYIRYGATKVCL